MPEYQRKKQEDAVEYGSKVGIVCCSNGLSNTRKEIVGQLAAYLKETGLVPVFSRYLYASDTVFSGTGQERAQMLMEFYRDSQIQAIFDISGGDIANEVIPYLDFEIIAKCKKQLWGYSDLTVLLNAIYSKTGNTGILYQIRNLISGQGMMQRKAFEKTVFTDEKKLFDFPYQFIQGNHMAGIIAGGNIRCLLKLAGTEFFPDLTGKILCLEASGGDIPQMVSYLTQLKLMGSFEKINGIILGTFTKIEQERQQPDIVSLVQSFAPDIPILKTQKIGHGKDSFGVLIGGYCSLRDQ
ncbi:MAG: LD-carboxypeptidase [Eubacterium sp.]|nr:LD-carboxypeptidase [Eubacterium sp.]